MRIFGGMRLNGEEIGDLEHQLSRGVEGNFYQTCARRGAKVRTQRCTCVVEGLRGLVREVQSEYLHVEIASLKKAHSNKLWHHKGDVVYGSCQLRPIQTSWTWILPQPNCVEEVPVNSQWHRLELFSVEAS